MIAAIDAGIAAAKAMANNSFFVGSVYSGVPAVGKNQQTKRTKYDMKNVNNILIMTYPCCKEKVATNFCLSLFC